MPSEPTVNELLDLAREWINTRDNITNRIGSSLTILNSDQQFMNAMNAFQQRALVMVGTSDWYLWEGLTEMLFMAKNSLPTPKPGTSP
jgi:hypothetical protein